jgi:hypothetical protein
MDAKETQIIYVPISTSHICRNPDLCLHIFTRPEGPQHLRFVLIQFISRSVMESGSGWSSYFSITWTNLMLRVLWTGRGHHVLEDLHVERPTRWKIVAVIISLYYTSSIDEHWSCRGINADSEHSPQKKIYRIDCEKVAWST